MSAKASFFYVISQFGGGVAGTALAHVMFDLPILQIAQTDRASPPIYLAEFVATFGLIFVILMGRINAPTNVPLLVGLYISAGYWFTSSTSFANPAVTIARSFSDTFSGIAPQASGFFIAAQLLAIWPALRFAQWLTQSRKD